MTEPKTSMPEDQASDDQELSTEEMEDVSGGARNFKRHEFYGKDLRNGLRNA